jgi:hypothetical protein
MCGICGNYNGDPDDEYTTREGNNVFKMRTSQRDFAIGQSWQTIDLSGEGGT